jgi:hypothetical protein
MIKYIYVILILAIIPGMIKKQVDFFSEKKPKIVIFFHICSLRNWKRIFLEQINLMKKSGLYYDAESINLGFLGEKNKILPFLNDKIKLVYHSKNIREYEKPTINKLLEFSKKSKEPYHVLYLHSKGVSKKETMSECIKHWRFMMSYYLVSNYKKCLNYLKIYDTIGCNLSMGFFNEKRDKYPRWWNCRFDTEKHFIHYSGNYWWSKTDFLKKNKFIIEDENKKGCGKDWYLLTERWLLLNLPKIKVLEIKSTPETHLYYKKYDYEFFKKKKKLFTIDRNLNKIFINKYF